MTDKADSTMFRDLPGVVHAIAFADKQSKLEPLSDELRPWRLYGAIIAIGPSKHYSDAPVDVREHCYNVAHDAIAAANDECVSNGLARPCGDWCRVEGLMPKAALWCSHFLVSMEANAGALVRAGIIGSEQIAILYAAAIERLARDSKDFDSVHIGYKAYRLLLDKHAPAATCL